MAVPYWGNQNKIVIKDPVKREVEKRSARARGYRPVLIKGVPMEIREFNDFGGTYYAIVLERIIEEKPPTI